MDLWSEIAPLIERGEESEKVEFKATVDLDDRGKRSEFARDISAIANTEGGEGYLIIGVADARNRALSPGPAGSQGSACGDQGVVGFSCPDPDKFRRDVAESLSLYCDPPPKVEVRFGPHPATGKTLAAVVVARSFARPHVVRRGGVGVEQDETWVRRGPACAKANRHEMAEMFGNQHRAIVINFSGHSLSESQVQRLRLEMNCTIQDVIERSWTLAHDRPFGEQAREVADALGLTPHTWQEAPIVVCPPGLAAATAVLLAELHGRMGHFPSVVRMRPVQAGTTVFEVGEVINLQTVRDRGRENR